MVGLIAALRLTERGDEVTLFERAAHPGGLAASFRPFCDSDPLERHYHHLFKTDRRMVRLIDELGLSERLFWRRPITLCLCGDRLARLDTAPSLLGFAPLGAADRARLAFALALLKFSPSAAPFHHLRATHWLRRVAGIKAYNTVFGPLFEAKFATHAADVSLAWFWARIHDRTASLGYLRGGFAVLYERLADRIRETGGTLAYGADVRAIQPSRAGFTVAANGVERTAPLRFDRVVVTAPLHGLLAICPAVPRWFAQRYAQRRGLLARSLVLALDRPLTDAYWINICEPAAPFAVIVCHTNLADATSYGQRNFIFLGAYGPTFADLSTSDLIELSAPYLRRVNPNFSLGWVLDAWQFVAADAQPIVTTTYRAAIPPHATPLPGLYLANLGQVYPHDRGQNYAIALAESVVALMAGGGRRSRFDRG